MRRLLFMNASFVYCQKQRRIFSEKKQGPLGGFIQAGQNDRIGPTRICGKCKLAGLENGGGMKCADRRKD